MTTPHTTITVPQQTPQPTPPAAAVARQLTQQFNHPFDHRQLLSAATYGPDTPWELNWTDGPPIGTATAAVHQLHTLPPNTTPTHVSYQRHYTRQTMAAASLHTTSPTPPGSGNQLTQRRRSLDTRADLGHFDLTTTDATQKLLDWATPHPTTHRLSEPLTVGHLRLLAAHLHLPAHTKHSTVTATITAAADQLLTLADDLNLSGRPAQAIIRLWNTAHHQASNHPTHS